MLVRLVIKTILCYGYSVLPTLFDRIPVAIVRQWTVTTHGEAASAGILAEEHNW